MDFLIELIEQTNNDMINMEFAVIKKGESL